ncbi:unnamed protein product [Acanthosepion pharaonis]|uniref:Uncharacterized protein n=1 Tax=Acanthosepion pharaonis TaxID=158019 RepID=A0A812EFV6_ACAPH|nr:unnamed protein product [Sepia pharaonis]
MATGETSCGSSYCDSQEKTTMVRKNDPWTPLPPSSSTLPMPKNPLYDIISSEEYLESLNKRLHQIRQQGTKEPSAKDILNGLAVKKADIMKQFLEENSSHLNEDDLNSLDAENFQTFLQRKIFPERQAISAEELVTLIQADELAKLVESQDLDTNVEAGSREVQD